MTHIITDSHLGIDKVKDIIDKGEKLVLGKEAAEKIIKCRKYLDSKMEDIGRPVYGVTTGFGSLCNITIPSEDLSRLQHNLVMSHACGTGERVKDEIVKLMLLLKIQSLSYGHSGVSLKPSAALWICSTKTSFRWCTSRVHSELQETSLP